MYVSIFVGVYQTGPLVRVRYFCKCDPRVWSTRRDYWYIVSWQAETLRQDPGQDFTQNCKKLYTRICLDDLCNKLTNVSHTNRPDSAAVWKLCTSINSKQSNNSFGGCCWYGRAYYKVLEGQIHVTTCTCTYRYLPKCRLSAVDIRTGDLLVFLHKKKEK